ncbi:hypothetical protein ABPG74_018190 [Tetrahymena malaccensis]
MYQEKIQYFQIPYQLHKNESNDLNNIQNLDEEVQGRINNFYKEWFDQIEQQIHRYVLLDEIQIDIKQIKHNTCLLIGEKHDWKFSKVFSQTGYTLQIKNVYLQDITLNQANSQKQLIEQDSEWSNFQLRLVKLNSKTKDIDQRNGRFLLMHFLSIKELQKQQNIIFLDLTEGEEKINQIKIQQINKLSDGQRDSFKNQIKQEDQTNMQIEKYSNLNNKQNNQPNSSLSILQNPHKNIYQSKENQFEISYDNQQKEQIKIEQIQDLDDILNSIYQFETCIQQRKKQKVDHVQQYSSKQIQEGIKDMLANIEELQVKYQQQLQQSIVLIQENDQNVILNQSSQQNSVQNVYSQVCHPQKQIFHNNQKQGVEQKSKQKLQIIDLTQSDEENKSQENRQIVKFDQKKLIQNASDFVVNSINQKENNIPQKKIKELDLENKHLKNSLKDAVYQLCQKNINEAKLQYQIFLLQNPSYKLKNEENDYLIIE